MCLHTYKHARARALQSNNNDRPFNFKTMPCWITPDIAICQCAQWNYQRSKIYLQGCTSLKTINAPQLTEINYLAFWKYQPGDENAPQLTEIHGGQAFRECASKRHRSSFVQNKLSIDDHGGQLNIIVVSFLLISLGFLLFGLAKGLLAGISCYKECKANEFEGRPGRTGEKIKEAKARKPLSEGQQVAPLKKFTQFSNMNMSRI